MLKEIKHFILHLRLHYQFFILSGGYLLGGLLADQMNTAQFWLQFINVHILLFGGATAYNSYWDKDKGPIGGLKNPPEMTLWMHRVSLAFMFAGLLWSLTVGLIYSLIFAASLILFWLYSTPHARWKGKPVKSMLVIGISTGTNSVIMGVLAAGGEVSLQIVLGSIGAALILLSIYPVSQIFQGEEDKLRGDTTFYLEYGLSGIKNCFLILFPAGLLIIFYSLYQSYSVPAIVFFATGLLSYLFMITLVLKLKGVTEEYEKVMGLKFFASLSFVLFLMAANAIRYEWIGQTFLKEYF